LAVRWQANLTAKMLGYLLATSIVPLALLGVAAFEISKRIVVTQAEADNTRLIGSFASYLGLYTQQVEDIAANIAGNNSVGEALRQAEYSENSTLSQLAVRTEMGRILNSYVRVKGLVSIDLFTPKGARFHVGETLNFDSVPLATQQALLAQAQVSPRQLLWRGADDNLNGSSSQKKVISLVRLIQHSSPVTGKSDVVGLLVISLNDEVIRTFLRGVQLTEGAALMQLDHKGHVALHSDPALFGQPLDPALLALVRASEPVRQFNLNGEPVLMHVTPQDALGNQIVVITPRQPLNDQVNRLAMVTTMLIALGLLISATLMLAFERRVARPLRAISEGFRRLGLHPERSHSPLPVPLDRGEIGQLVQGFNDHLSALNAQRAAAGELRRSEALREATALQLRESEAQLRVILDEMPIGVLLLDAEDRILLKNRHFQDLFGYLDTESAAVDMGHWWATVFPEYPYVESARLAHQGAAPKEEGAPPVWPTRVLATQRHGGEIRHVQVSGTRAGTLWIFTFVDHTQYQLHQQQLEVAKADAESANKAKSGFLATMSHEIRTPMNGILGMLKLLEHTDLSARQLDYAQKAQSATRALLGIINDILDFSKIEAGKMELDLQPMVLSEILRDLSVILSANLGDKPIEVVFSLDPKTPPVLVGDAMRLRQVLLNLAGNAVKFTDQGEVVLSIRLIQQTPARVWLRFGVEDSGIGIAEDKIERVFEGFSQAESSTSRRYGGTGLGLAISKRMVELMGGMLSVQSTQGKGSSFSFDLELAIASPEQAATLERNAPLRTPVDTGTQVLIVDDHAIARDVLLSMTHSMGWPSLAVESGVAAMALLESRDAPTFHTILVDWQMPGMDGWETIRRMRHFFRGKQNPVIIMVSGRGREMLAEKSHREAQLLDGYVVKPITASMLHDAVVEAQASRSDTRVNKRTEPGPRRLNGLRLLVVEDNLLNQQVAQELLSRQGATVKVASGGLEGVEMALTARPPYDAILMDMQMPDIDGLEATRRICADPAMAGVPVIAMTANAMDADKQACADAGMVDHVSKPIEMDHLIATLLRHAKPSLSSGAEGVPDNEAAGKSPEVTVPKGNLLPSVSVVQGPIDSEVAVERLGNDQALYAQVVRSFQNQAREMLHQLESDVAELRWMQARGVAHTLKGLAATVGAPALADSARAAEQAIQSIASGLPEQPEKVGSNLVTVEMDDLRRQLFAVLDAFADMFPAEDGRQSLDCTAIDLEQIRPQFEELEKLLGQNHMRSTRLAQALRKQLGGTFGTTLDPLFDAVAALDFPVALAHCQKMKRTVWPIDAG